MFEMDNYNLCKDYNTLCITVFVKINYSTQVIKTVIFYQQIEPFEMFHYDTCQKVIFETDRVQYFYSFYLFSQNVVQYKNI